MVKCLPSGIFGNDSKIKIFQTMLAAVYLVIYLLECGLCTDNKAIRTGLVSHSNQGQHWKVELQFDIDQ